MDMAREYMSAVFFCCGGGGVFFLCLFLNKYSVYTSTVKKVKLSCIVVFLRSSIVFKHAFTLLQKILHEKIIGHEASVEMAPCFKMPYLVSPRVELAS